MVFAVVAVVVDVVIPSDSNIRKKGHERFKQYQSLKGELERMWGVKTSLVPVVIGALRAVSLETAKILPGPAGSQASGRGPEFEGDRIIKPFYL